jgi:sigma-B regulation protein RsbU (phosphoserine phosphatase)
MTANRKAVRVLLADDQPDVLLALRLLLKMEGFQSEAVSSPVEILQMSGEREFDLILMDLNYTRDTTSGEEGLDLLAKLRQRPEAPPVIVMTAWSSIDLAVEAMRRGAVDFVAKPWDNGRLLATLRKNVRSRSSSDELTIARKVQHKLFPQVRPALQHLVYDAVCVEAGPVGGDYYDFLDVGQDRLGLVLADVCGKGIGAALLMANLQATLRSHCLMPSGSNADWPEMLSRVNLQFHQTTAPEHFATAFFGEYDDRTRTLRYVNCGHNPPLLLRAATDTVERLEATAWVLGAFRHFRASVGEVQLQPDDWLILFSDGIAEAQSDDSDFFGEERVVATARRHRHRDVRGMIEGIQEEVDRFASQQGRDDWTLVAARAAA